MCIQFVKCHNYLSWLFFFYSMPNLAHRASYTTNPKPTQTMPYSARPNGRPGHDYLVADITPRWHGTHLSSLDFRGFLLPLPRRNDARVTSFGHVSQLHFQRMNHFLSSTFFFFVFFFLCNTQERENWFSLNESLGL